MKIGIVTNHRAHNYGSVLQAYALYHKLKSEGLNVEIIDYWPRYKSDQYALFRWSYYFKTPASFSSTIKTWIKRVISFPERWLRYTKFNLFINRHFSFGKRTFKNGSKIPDKYDLIIFAGEIWKHQTRKQKIVFDEVYVGKYPESSQAKKVAYSICHTSEETNKYVIEKLAKYLENFNAVSIREEYLSSQLTDLADTNIKTVLDPIFLLSENEWRELVKTDKPQKRYLLFYQQMKSDEAARIAKKIAKEKGLEIVEVRGYVGRSLLLKKVRSTAGPIEFLSLIANADYVVSTSFHGIAFAVLFGKQFTALGFKNNGLHVRDMFKALGIEKATIQKDLSNYYDGVDYDAVHTRLKELREESVRALFSNIKTGTVKVHYYNTPKRTHSSL